MTAFNLSKERFIATSAMIDLGIDISRTLVYAGNGYIHSHDLYLVPFLIGISIIAAFIGYWPGDAGGSSALGYRISSFVSKNG